MITKVFNFEDANPVCRVQLPVEYGYFSVIVEMRLHPNETIDEYIEQIKKTHETNESKDILIVVKRNFEKEGWTKYYKAKEKDGNCPTCGQHLPEGHYDWLLKQQEYNCNNMFGVKLISEEYLLEKMEEDKKKFE